MDGRLCRSCEGFVMIFSLCCFFPLVSCGLSSMPALSVAFLLLFPWSDAAAPLITDTRRCSITPVEIPRWNKSRTKAFLYICTWPLNTRLLHFHIINSYVQFTLQPQKPAVLLPLWLFILTCIQVYFDHFYSLMITPFQLYAPKTVICLFLSVKRAWAGHWLHQTFCQKLIWVVGVSSAQMSI